MVRLNIPFITHFAYTANKIKVNKFKKANAQLLYNGSINRFSRNIFMQNMHSFLSEYISKLEDIKDFPISVYLTFYVPKNYSNIKLINGTIRYSANEDVEPTFDLDNLSYIWRKAIHDTLKSCGKIPDDNVIYIRKLIDEIKFIPIDTNLKIELKIEKYEEDR